MPLSTTKYEMFQLHEFNRDVKKTTRLEESMRKHGWIDAYPMHVVKNGKGKLKIKGGHHRFEVAMRLGIPVKYEICNDTATIHELERSTTRWKLPHYLESWKRVGKNTDYFSVDDYQKRTGIGLLNCIALLGGELASSGNKVASFKNGTFKVNDNGRAQIVADVVRALKEAGVKFATNTTMVQAISRLSFVEVLDVERLIQKIKTFSHLIEKQPCLSAYAKMLEDIYNRQSGKKLPLLFLADESARSRNVIFK